jgi:hypothetical protein
VDILRNSILAEFALMIHQIIFGLLVIASFATQSMLAKAQSLLDSGDSSGVVASTAPAKLDLTYTRPAEATKIRNYLFDAFGPYPIVSATFTAGFDQTRKTPWAWGRGAEGYHKRFASDFTIAAIGTTTRYALAEVFKEDTLYYRCECKGVCSFDGPVCLYRGTQVLDSVNDHSHSQPESETDG